MKQDNQNHQPEITEEEKMEGVKAEDFFKFADDFRTRAKNGEEPYKTISQEAERYMAIHGEPWL